MEKFAYKIIKLIQEKLLLFKELKKILEQERKYVGDMDIDALWEMTNEKKRIASEVEKKRERILESLKENGIWIKGFQGPSRLMDEINKLAFPAAVKSDLNRLKVELDIIKKEVTLMAMDNKRHADEYLKVINNIFETITDAEHREKYSSKGQLLKGKTEKYLIRAEV